MRKSNLKMTEICGEEVVGKKTVTLARPTTFDSATIYTVVSAAKIQQKYGNRGIWLYVTYKYHS